MSKEFIHKLRNQTRGEGVLVNCQRFVNEGEENQ